VAAFNKAREQQPFMIPSRANNLAVAIAYMTKPPVDDDISYSSEENASRL
jgi:hypothetical protein